MIFEKDYKKKLYFIQHQYKTSWFDIHHDFHWNIDFKKYPKYNPHDIREILPPFSAFSHNVGLCSLRGCAEIQSAMHLMLILKEFNPNINFRVVRRNIQINNLIVGTTK